MLRVLGRRVEGTAALVLATYRDDEVERGHPLRVVLGGLAAAAGGRASAACPPSPRGPCAPSPSRAGSTATEIQRRPAGTPFFVTEIVAGGGDGGARDRARRRARPGGACSPPRPGGCSRGSRSCPARAEPGLLESGRGRRAGRGWTGCLASGMLGEAATRSPSVTSSPGSRSRVDRRPTGGAACTRRSSRGSRRRPRASLTLPGSLTTPRGRVMARLCSRYARAAAARRAGPARTGKRRPSSGAPSGYGAGLSAEERAELLEATRHEAASSPGGGRPRRSRRGGRRSPSSGSATLGGAILSRLTDRRTSGRARTPKPRRRAATHRRARGAAAEPRARDRVRRPGLPARLEPRQRRGGRLGRAGGRASLRRFDDAETLALGAT